MSQTAGTSFMLSLKIVTVDSYLNSPISGWDPTYSQFRKSAVCQVPVIRIFGVCSNGTKVCVHLHGVLPYIYVPVPDSFANNSEEFAQRMADCLDNALNAMTCIKSPKQHVFKISVVHGIPFYGYASQNRKFYKIYFYRPFAVKKAVEVLESGSIEDLVFQPYEAHLPFILQFFIDYNLYGMSYMNISKYSTRIGGFEAIAKYNELSGILHKVTYCELEIDALGDDILNRNLIGESFQKNPGLSYIWDEERERRRKAGESSQISFVSYDNPNNFPISTLEQQFRMKIKLTLEKHLSSSSSHPTSQETGLENTNILEASFHESHSQKINFNQIIDTQIRSLLETLNKRIMAEEDDEAQKERNRLEDDSILGSQCVEPDENIVEDDIDLTQPLDIPSSDDSDEYDNIPIIDNKINEQNSPGVLPSNSDSEPVSPDIFDIFVDGSADEIMEKKSSPKKRKTLNAIPFKYKPLDIKIVKSPQKENQLNGKKQPIIGSQVLGSMEESVSSWSLRKDYNEFHRGMNQSNTIVEKCEETYPVKEAIDCSTILNESVAYETNAPTCVSLCETTAVNNFNYEIKRFVPIASPPSRISLMENAPSKLNYTKSLPFYSDPKDQLSFQVGNLVKDTSTAIVNLEEFQGEFNSVLLHCQNDLLKSKTELDIQDIQKLPYNFVNTLINGRNLKIEPLTSPPTSKDASLWVLQKKLKSVGEEENKKNISRNDRHSIVSSANKDFASGSDSRVHSTLLDSISHSNLLNEATADNSGAFKMDFLNLQTAHATDTSTLLTVFYLELHIATRGSLKPDPEYDSIEAIFYVVKNDVPLDSGVLHETTGIISQMEISMVDLPEDTLVTKTESEVETLMKLIDKIRDYNPDILAGYEIEMLSWGYVIQRAYILGINILPQLGRVLISGNSIKEQQLPEKQRDIVITGRILLNIWRIMRHEINATSYTFENVVYHILHTRVPHYSFETLTKWWSHFPHRFRNLTVSYYLLRVNGMSKLLETLDLISRTSELASLFGIQFYEVLSRGSQFRVESMMLRMAKPLNFIAISPNIHQRAAMRAPACLPLVMEPHSRFYTDPVIVLDFQSLYPSMMIAYNYCFSTCLGRVEELIEGEEFKFGCARLNVSKEELLQLKNNIHVSPVGVAFVDSTVRKGILPAMLEEILETRLMVKKSMKKNKNNQILYKILHARQLGLKLIANVTYGYTSANFSGRMPCIEVGDSVVSKGRETLEKAIELVKETKRWEADVVYGDTDSLFVLCPGKSKEEAFVIGEEIAEAVTLLNPKPVKLKLEKVYLPCLLQTKKRYVGNMFESPDQKLPCFDAKGIETVRRDGCSAASKTCDASQVKNYVQTQLLKVHLSSLPLQDFIFAREYRGINGYQPGACVPSLKLTKEWLLKDRRAEPRVGERVGYVIICGPPKLPIIRLVRSPTELLSNPSLYINSEYYITKAILPPLDRCFKLIGIDVFNWYKSMPKIKKTTKGIKQVGVSKKETISQYFTSANCILCGELTFSEVCLECQNKPDLISLALFRKLGSFERTQDILKKICSSCVSRNYALVCSSLDCPIYYRKCLVDYRCDTQSIRNHLDLIFQNNF